MFADAFVTGIFGGDPELLSLPACLPHLAQLEREYGSILKGLAATAHKRRQAARQRGEVYRRPGAMWSLRDGLRLLVESLRERLKTPPVFGVHIQKVEKTEDRGQRTENRGPDFPSSVLPSWMVRADGKEPWTADALVLACPAYQQAGLLSDLDPELADRIGQVPYNRVAVVALGYRRPDVPIALDGFGFIAPQRTRRDVLGVHWCSSIFPGRAPEGAVLLQAICGGWHRPEIVDWDDERLSQAIRTVLSQAMGITAAPIFQDIIRWQKAIPQYHVGHLSRLAWLERHRQRHPGLFLTGNAYNGVSINDCIEQGTILAAKVEGYLIQPPTNVLSP